MALTGKTIGELEYLQFPTNETLIPVQYIGATYHITFSSITYNYGTYDQFVAEAYNGLLTPGRFYLMSDYQACYDQPNFDSDKNPISTGNYKTGSTEPLLLLAISTTGFSPTVYSTLYPQDKITYDINWNITEVTSGPAKGRITERIDEFNNRTDYDHRSIQFKRYEYIELVMSDPLLGLVYVDTISPTEMSVSGLGTSFTSLSVGNYVGFGSVSGFKAYEITSISGDTEMIISGLTTFSLMSGIKMYNGYLQADTSFYQNNISTEYTEYYTFDYLDTNINNYVGNYANLYTYDENRFILANNVFKGSAYINNTFGDGCFNNTFDDDCSNNIVGNYFYNNITDDDFDGNVIANYFNNNKITSNFQYNKIGEYFESNYLVQNSFYRNNIGNNFEYNVVDGDDFQNNEIGNQFANNNILNAQFYKNDIGNGYNNNNIYSQFYGNLITNGFNDNVIYSEFYDNRISEYFENNDIGDSGNTGNFQFYRNLIGTQFNNNTVRQDFQNNQIGNGFNNNTINGSFYKNVIGNGFHNNSNIGSDFFGNHIGNGFNNNQTISDYFQDNIIGEYFNYNSTSLYFENNRINNEFNNNTFGDSQYYGWGNTTFGNLTSRTYDTFYNSLDGGGIGAKILGKEFIMYIAANDSYNKVKFTQWTQGGNGGGFSYQRQQVYPTVGSIVYFTKTNYGNEIDIIVPGVIEITRGNANGIYNIATEGSWNSSVSPQGTEWNSIYTQANNGSFFQNNNIGNYFYSNQISNNFKYNTIGDNFGNNTIDENFGFGYADTQGNKIGNNFINNIIGEYFYNNTIPDNFYQNIIGNYFQWNVINTVIGLTNFTTYYGNITAFTYTSTVTGATDGTYLGVEGTTNGIGVNASFFVEVSGGTVVGVSGDSQGQLYVTGNTISLSGDDTGVLTGPISGFTQPTLAVSVYKPADTTYTYPSNESEMTYLINNSPLFDSYSTQNLVGVSYSTQTGIDQNNYAMQIVGTITIPTSDTYYFGLSSDDGSDAFIDGIKVADWYGAHGDNSGTPAGNWYPIFLSAGTYPLLVRMQEVGGGDVVRLKYGSNGSQWSNIPDSWFVFVNSGTTGTYTNLPVSGGTGIDATFDVTVVDNLVDTIVLNNSGSGYTLGDTLIISGSSFGGTDGVDDILLTISSIDYGTTEITVTGISVNPSVYETYTCQIFERQGGDKRLSYYDSSDILTIKNINE